MFYIAWWIHLLILLTFLVYVPQSKHAHLIAGPVNVFFDRLDQVQENLKKLILKMKHKKHSVLVKLKTLDKINLSIYMPVSNVDVVQICVQQQEQGKCFTNGFNC